MTPQIKISSPAIYWILLGFTLLSVCSSAQEADFPEENDSLKSVYTKPFEVTLNYDFYDCGGQLISIAEMNGQPPFFWYELDSLGFRVNTWVNPKMQQLKDETLYLVEDAWQRRDTIYIAFNHSVRLEGLHPNPFRENFAIHYKADIPIMVDVKIFDLSGRPIDNRSFMLDTEKQQMNFNPQNWSKGTYILKLQSVCFSKTMKLVYMGE